MASVETRTENLEKDVSALHAQESKHQGIINDLMLKIEDQEKRARRNNLRFLAIPEGVEGNDPRAFMVTLLKETLPELESWEWDREVQRAHRFPLTLSKHPKNGTQYPRVGFLREFYPTPNHFRPCATK